MKKTKQLIQTALLMSMLQCGFQYAYVNTWQLIGLPVAWWSDVIVVIFAGLSNYGLIRWIGRG